MKINELIQKKNHKEAFISIGRVSQLSSALRFIKTGLWSFAAPPRWKPSRAFIADGAEHIFSTINTLAIMHGMKVCLCASKFMASNTQFSEFLANHVFQTPNTNRTTYSCMYWWLGQCVRGFAVHLSDVEGGSARACVTIADTTEKIIVVIVDRMHANENREESMPFHHCHGMQTQCG